MRWLVMVAVLAACSRDRPAASTGSGSESTPAVAVAVAVDAMVPDAPKLALQVLRSCDIVGAGVHCTVTPKDGVLRANRCWRASVAIEDHAAAKLRLVTSEPACTGAVAMGSPTALDLTFAARDHLTTACAADDACEVMLSDVDELANDQAAWRAQLQAQLADEKAAREQAARDREPADDDAVGKLYEHYVQLSIEDDMNLRWKEHPDRREVEMSIRSPGPMILHGAVPDRPLTKGEVTCALAASSGESFRSCFASADDAGVPGD
jgi:hypothetical protein